MKAKYKIKKKEGTRTLILHSEKRQVINQVDLKKLHDLILPGFIEPMIQNAMGKKLKLSYSITGTHSLEWILKNGIRKEQFVDLIDQLNQILKLVEKQNLDIRALLLDRKTVMMSQNSGQLNLIYVPIQYYDGGCDVRRFYESLAYNTVFDSQEETEYVTDFLRTLNSSVTFARFSLEEFVLRHKNAESNQSSMICPHCGNQVKAGELFCSFCNWDLREKDEKNDRIQPEIKRDLASGTTVLTPTSSPTTVLQEIQEEEKAWLLQLRGQAHISIYAFPFVIGKERAQCDYAIQGNTNVSRKHAVFVIEDDRVCIQDLNSTNHTYVNGQRVPPKTSMVLADNDQLKLANEEFIFHQKGLNS